MLGHLDKKFDGWWWWVGDIAIIASSSRSRSDFEIELYIEICEKSQNNIYPKNENCVTEKSVQKYKYEVVVLLM